MKKLLSLYFKVFGIFNSSQQKKIYVFRSDNSRKFSMEEKGKQMRILGQMNLGNAIYHIALLVISLTFALRALRVLHFKVLLNKHV